MYSMYIIIGIIQENASKEMIGFLIDILLNIWLTVEYGGKYENI